MNGWPCIYCGAIIMGGYKREVMHIQYHLETWFARVAKEASE